MIGEVGPYNSDCAYRQVERGGEGTRWTARDDRPGHHVHQPHRPSANLAQRDVEALYAGHPRNFARLLPDDAAQGAGAAVEAKRLGAKTVFVLSDGGYGTQIAASFVRAARALRAPVLGLREWQTDARRFPGPAQAVAKAAPRPGVRQRAAGHRRRQGDRGPPLGDRAAGAHSRQRRHAPDLLALPAGGRRRARRARNLAWAHDAGAPPAGRHLCAVRRDPAGRSGRGRGRLRSAGHDRDAGRDRAIGRHTRVRRHPAAEGERGLRAHGQLQVRRAGRSDEHSDHDRARRAGGRQRRGDELRGRDRRARRFPERGLGG